MKKACGTWLATYVVLAAATGLIVYRRIPEPAIAAICGAVGGGLAWMAVAYFAGIATKIARARMIRRGLGGEIPADGEKIAAIGRISSSGGALTSPLSKSPCVAYKYEIRSGLGQDDFIYFDGFALTPSVIQGRMRNIRLLAWGDLEMMNWQIVSLAIAQPNAEEYIKATEFREPTVLNFRKAITDISAIYKDDDGSVRWDQRGVRPPLDATRPLDQQNFAYREKLVRPGDSVCVIGHYSAERGGIVPSKNPLIDAVSIEVGDENVFARRASSSAVAYFFGGAIFSAIYIGALVAFHASIPLSATEQHRPSMIASWTEIRLEQLLERRVRPHMPAGLLSNDNYVIKLDRGSANGRVRLGGRDEVLSRAALRRDGDDRTIAIDNGAVTLTIDSRGKPLHLTLLGREVPVAAADVRIMENGRSEVAGRVTYISDDPAAPVCRVTFRTAG